MQLVLKVLRKFLQGLTMSERSRIVFQAPDAPRYIKAFIVHIIIYGSVFICYLY